MEKPKEKFPCVRCSCTPEYVFKIWAYERDIALRYLRRRHQSDGSKCWWCLQRYVFKLWAISQWAMKEFEVNDLIVMRYVLSSYLSLNLTRVLIQVWKWNIHLRWRYSMGYNEYYKSQVYRAWIRTQYWNKRSIEVHQILYEELMKHGEVLIAKVKKETLDKVKEDIIDPMVVRVERGMDKYEAEISRLKEENERLKLQLSKS